MQMGYQGNDIDTRSRSVFFLYCVTASFQVDTTFHFAHDIKLLCYIKEYLMILTQSIANAFVL